MKKTTIAVIVSAVAAAVIFAVTYISSVSFLGAAWIVVSGILTIAIALIITTAVFLTFTIIFLVEIYLVVQPIIAGLCVYR